MDWNWFFSSLAQSGAALVGIIGAFVISKLINENERYHGIIQRVRELALIRRNLKFELNQCHFEWYNEMKILGSLEFWDVLNRDEYADIEDVNERAEAYLLSVGGLYDHPSNIEIVKKIMSRNEDDFSEYAGMFSPQYGRGLSNNLDAEKYRIESIRYKCTDTISKHRHLKRDIEASQDNQKQLKAIVIILMVGVFLIVCYPLSFLPLETNWNSRLILSYSNTLSHFFSIQGWMLFLLLVIIDSVFYVFIASISKMAKTYKTILKSITENRLNMWGYSEYFEHKPVVKE